MIRTATTSALDVRLSMSAFTVAPGATFSIELFIGCLANASPGYSALVDASRSAQMSIVLPLGVTLASPIPLQWVTSAVSITSPPVSQTLPAGGSVPLSVAALFALFGSRNREYSTRKLPEVFGQQALKT